MKVKVVGVEILIDEIDVDILNECSWCLSGGYVYASTSKYRGQQLQRVIAERMGLDLSGDIDHRDTNPLNNQRVNLRSATRSQNSANTGKSKNNTSGYKGVHWDKKNKNGLHRFVFNVKKSTLVSSTT